MSYDVPCVQVTKWSLYNPVDWANACNQPSVRAGRWRSLMKRNDNDIKSVPTLVTACCVLHNLCEIQGDTCEEEWIQRIESEKIMHASTSSAAMVSTTGQNIREALCDYFDTV